MAKIWIRCGTLGGQHTRWRRAEKDFSKTACDWHGMGYVSISPLRTGAPFFLLKDGLTGRCTE
jgi:hypothetical protein